jgi:hypothetical protein
MGVTASRRRRVINLMALRHMLERVFAVQASGTDVRVMTTLVTVGRAVILETRIWSMIGNAW